MTNDSSIDSAAPRDGDRDGGLLAWQRRHYEEGHTTRANLVVHAITAPLFVASTIALACAPFVSRWLALAGVGLVVALIAQGRGHGAERRRPFPFRGPGDFVARFFVEQWVTFPRFLWDGGFARAWRHLPPRLAFLRGSVFRCSVGGGLTRRRGSTE